MDSVLPTSFLVDQTEGKEANSHHFGCWEFRLCKLQSCKPSCQQEESSLFYWVNLNIHESMQFKKSQRPLKLLVVLGFFIPSLGKYWILSYKILTKLDIIKLIISPNKKKKWKLTLEIESQRWKQSDYWILF